MEKFQILSLDGGGIRGIFIASVLAEIEKRNKTKITDHFDLIVGTSTGGIIAIGLGLGLGMSAKDILNFYTTNGATIFPSLIPKWLKWIPLINILEPRNIQSLVRRKFSNTALQSALKEAFPEKKLGHSLNRLVIPSYNPLNNQVKLFKTAHNERFSDDYKRPAWEVALATSAAPTFFSATKSQNRYFIDGGLWANDPIMVGITEAAGVLGEKLSETSVLSIGALNETHTFSQTKIWGGIVPWLVKSKIINAMMSGQTTSAQGQAKLLLGKESIIRINPPVAAGRYSLDDFSKMPELLSFAEHEAEHTFPKIKEKFLNHKASLFIPNHRVNK